MNVAVRLLPFLVIVGCGPTSGWVRDNGPSSSAAVDTERPMRVRRVASVTKSLREIIEKRASAKEFTVIFTNPPQGYIEGDLVQGDMREPTAIVVDGVVGRIAVPAGYDPAVPIRFASYGVAVDLPKAPAPNRVKDDRPETRDGWAVRLAPLTPEVSFGPTMDDAVLIVRGPVPVAGRLTTFRLLAASLPKPPVPSDAEVILEEDGTRITRKLSLGLLAPGKKLPVSIVAMTSPATAIDFRFAPQDDDNTVPKTLAAADLGEAAGRRWSVVRGSYGDVKWLNDYQWGQRLGFLRCDPPLRPDERLVYVADAMHDKRRLEVGEWGNMSRPIVAEITPDGGATLRAWIQRKAPERVVRLGASAPDRRVPPENRSLERGGLPIAGPEIMYDVPVKGLGDAHSIMGLRPSERAVDANGKTLGESGLTPAWPENAPFVLSDAGVTGTIGPLADLYTADAILVLTLPKEAGALRLRAPRGRYFDRSPLGEPIESRPIMAFPLPSGFLRRGDRLEIAGTVDDRPFRLLLPVPYVPPFSANGK